MRKIKIIRSAFIAVAISLLSGCVESTETSRPAVPEVKIGVLLYTRDDTFITSLQSGIEKMARAKELEENVKIIINSFDGKGSQTAQNEQIDKCMDQNYDVLCVNLVDRTAAASVIDKAKANSTPIVFFNREPVREDLERSDNVYYIGTDASEAGILQGNIIVDEYYKNPERVDRNGDGKLQYVMLEGEQVHQDTLLRSEYCVKTVVNSGIQVEKLATETANWQRNQAATKTLQFIKAYGDNIDVIFSNNDDMALGASDAYAYEDISELPLIVGVDYTEPAAEAIRSGRMTGTVSGNLTGQAEAILNLSYSLARTGGVDESVTVTRGKYIMLKNETVTIENIDEVER